MSRPRTIASLAAGVLLVLAGPVSFPARSAPLPYPWSEIDAVDCAIPPSPATVHVPVVDPEGEVTVDLLLVLDRGITETRARQVVANSQAAYAPLHMKLRVAGVRRVVLEDADAQGIINQTKHLFPDDERPKGVDAVATMTSVDIVAGAAGNGVAGLADCIGGVRYPTRSYLVAEVPGDEGYGIGVMFSGNLAAKILAHELGHLLGAHHHYGNCVEGTPSETEQSEVSPCTLMSPIGDFNSINFGAFEGAVARGYAEEYARP